MRTVGVIGGLGPETSAEFYLEVVFGCQSRGGTTRPPILLWSVPGAYEIERDAIERNVGTERYRPLLVDAARRLERAGADILVMPCNSLHVFIDDIRSAVQIPVLSIVEETARFLVVRGIDRVGLLATDITIKSGMYERALTGAGVRVVVPDGLNQARIGRTVRNIVVSRHGNRDREALLSIVHRFAQLDVQHVILACTDLQLLIPQHESLDIFDSMKILVDATVERVFQD
ncbi:MAG: aspartate/glutamate racemase family protein [Candidatus Woesearchaeota archaeon]